MCHPVPLPAKAVKWFYRFSLPTPLLQVSNDQSLNHMIDISLLFFQYKDYLVMYHPDLMTQSHFCKPCCFLETMNTSSSNLTDVAILSLQLPPTV